MRYFIFRDIFIFRDVLLFRDILGMEAGVGVAAGCRMSKFRTQYFIKQCLRPQI